MNNSIRPCDTKTILEEFLSYEGFTLDSRSFESDNFGSKGLSYYAVKGNVELLLDNAYPGDRRDWQSMFDFFLTKKDELLNGRDVSTALQLKTLKKTLGVRDDWHEPDEQDLTATVEGTKFDNAGIDGEMTIVIEKEGEKFRVNVATLLALATGYEDGTLPLKIS